MTIQDYFGRVLSVTEEHSGSVFSQAESAGATTIHLNNVDWASDDGGDIYIHLGRETKTYDSVNEGAKTLHLTAGLTNSYADDVHVEPWNPDTRTRWAEVLIEGSEYENNSEPVIVHIPGHFVHMMPTGTRRRWGERVLVRKDSRWRLYIKNIIGVNGDVVTWLYQTTPDVVSQSGFWLRPPYDATILSSRITTNGTATDEIDANLYHETEGVITVEDMVIKAGDLGSKWVKVWGDDGLFVQDNERIRCYVDFIPTDVDGPVHFHIRAIPKGAS